VLVTNRTCPLTSLCSKEYVPKDSDFQEQSTKISKSYRHEKELLLNLHILQKILDVKNAIAGNQKRYQLVRNFHLIMDKIQKMVWPCIYCSFSKPIRVSSTIPSVHIESRKLHWYVWIWNNRNNSKVSWPDSTPANVTRPSPIEQTDWALKNTAHYFAYSKIGHYSWNCVLR
jgi:hypothetical protein